MNSLNSWKVTKMSKKKIRPMGQIMLEMENLLTEMVVDHDLQWGDIFGLILTYLMVHLPGGREEYTQGGHPEFYYGPRRDR